MGGAVIDSCGEMGTEAHEDVFIVSSKPDLNTDACISTHAAVADDSGKSSYRLNQSIKQTLNTCLAELHQR